MTDLDHASLDRLLPATPGPADWDDVLSRWGAYQARRRRRLVIAFAVAAALVAMTAAAFGAVRIFVHHKGFIGLPPLGATPSSPANGELVLHYFGPNPGLPGKSRVWVYADGRVISLLDAPFSEGANESWTGFLEQRLTPDGVGQLQFEVIAAQGPGAKPLPDFTEIEVRDGGKLVPVTAVRDERLIEARLANPVSWLPASAWQDSEVKAYVPTTFGVCYGAWPPDQLLEEPRMFGLLPAAARKLLGGKASWTAGGFVMTSPGHVRRVFYHCSDLSTEEARGLASDLDKAEPTKKGGAARLNYQFGAKDGSGDTVQIYFEPYLPHGEITCSVCG